MQYLLMCCFEEARWLGLPDTERGAIMDEYGKVVQEWKSSGRLLGGAKLDLCARAVTIRDENGKPLFTDGPFAETKEQLGGYHVVECSDQQEAVALAQQIPTLAVGGVVEVRPILWSE